MSPTDSQNLQELHDMVAQLFSAGGFSWGLGIGITFGASLLLIHLLRDVWSERDN